MKRKASSISTFKSRLLTGLAAATVAALCQQPAAAEDIDLFAQPPAAAGAPNVLIILDNTANWNGPFVNEKAALISTVQNLPVNADGTAKLRVGLMLYTESGGQNKGEDGGYLRSAVRDFADSPSPYNYKTRFVNLVNSLHILNDKSNGGKAGKTMADAYRYFAGQAPRTGNNKVKTDYTGNTAGGTAQSNAIYALPDVAPNGNALDAFLGTPYRSPVASGSCGKNFIIYISNGAPQDNNSDNSTASGWLSADAAAAGISGATTQLPISPSGSASNVADEWARFMKKSTYGIVTYAVDVDRVTNGQGPGWTALLKSMATVSSGKYFDVNSGNGGAQIADALNTIFSEIQSVNSVFASVSLPVSVNNSATFLNQIYIGMFRPDSAPLPRWVGNLKQYKLGLSAARRLETQDADSTSAVNNATGFITECARSFWTPTAVDSYWAFKPQGACLTVAGSADSNYPDGPVVEKGAQGYMLRAGTGARSPFNTCLATSPTSCTDLTDFSIANNNISATALGASTAERDELINWASGLDIDDENINANTTERRPSMHGDVVHSRPVAINMGTDVSPQVVVFYGGNDGVLRAINGNRTASIGSFAAGTEMWAFMAPEFYPSIKRLRDNLIPIDYFGNTLTSPDPEPKPYGFDGPITAHRSVDTLWLFGSLRRGGQTVYAFDVSTINDNPPSPLLKWRHGCDATGCTTNFEEMGQTWSAPIVMKSAFDPDAPMLIVGGGYDVCEDADPHGCTDAMGTFVGKGNRIYVLDADSGGWLTEFTTDRGVAADVFVIKDEATGLAKWAYAADLGGNIYRISGVDANTEIADTDPANWTMTKIASLGCPSGGCGTDPNRGANRKFMMPLDVVEAEGGYVILVGSGDREKPLKGWTKAYNASNYFFKIVDHPTDTAWLSSEPGQVIGLSSLLSIGVADPDPTATALATKPKGWYLGLEPHEQVVTSAITVFGTTTFSTHIPHEPVAGACGSTLGKAFVYNIAFANAAARNGTDPSTRGEEIVGGGLPPSPVAGMVTLDDGTTTLPFLIGGETNSPLEGTEPIPSGLAAQPKSQTYWYIHK